MLVERGIERAWVELTIAAPATVETDLERPECYARSVESQSGAVDIYASAMLSLEMRFAS